MNPHALGRLCLLGTVKGMLTVMWRKEGKTFLIDRVVWCTAIIIATSSISTPRYGIVLLQFSVQVVFTVFRLTNNSDSLEITAKRKEIKTEKQLGNPVTSFLPFVALFAFFCRRHFFSSTISINLNHLVFFLYSWSKMLLATCLQTRKVLQAREGALLIA